MKNKNILLIILLIILALLVTLSIVLTVKLIEARKRLSPDATGGTTESTASSVMTTNTGSVTETGTFQTTETTSNDTEASTSVATSLPSDTKPGNTDPVPTTVSTTTSTSNPSASTTALVHFITENQAENIAIKTVGDGAQVLSIERELDDSPPKYELDLTLDGYQYNLEIHAVTGAVIGYEKKEIGSESVASAHD